MTTQRVSFDASGILVSLLTVLFVGLKLTGFIAWSWWWVLSPLWLPLAVVLAGCGLVFACLGLWATYVHWQANRK